MFTKEFQVLLDDMLKLKDASTPLFREKPIDVVGITAPEDVPWDVSGASTLWSCLASLLAGTMLWPTCRVLIAGPSEDGHPPGVTNVGVWDDYVMCFISQLVNLIVDWAKNE